MKNYILFIPVLLFMLSCSSPGNIREETQKYLDNYTKTYQGLHYVSSLAEWASDTKIIEGDPTNAIATRKANEALAKFTGSTENIRQAQKFLQQKDKLATLQIKQLETILYYAANNPEIVEDIVKKRIKAETEQTEKLFGFDFLMDGQSVSPNEIDEILCKETNLDKRLKAWKISKEIGKELKDGLATLQKLRNETVQALEYDDFFTYQVLNYEMTTRELSDMMKQVVREIWPIYRELHTYARYELAEKYNVEEVPDMLPAHWLPNRWGQDWNTMLNVEGLNLDSILSTKTPEWIIEQGERFYISIGFPKLPESFWERSDLYQLPPDAGYKKNNHGSAWHLDLENDVRCLMSIVPNRRWYETSHHELGHIYYYLTYTNPDVPVLLRGGANRGYHEAIGTLMELTSTQKPYLAQLNLLPQTQSDPTSDTGSVYMRTLLKEALNYIVFISWSAGVMTEFELDLYVNDLPKDEYNKRWWELKAKYQGIVPPEPRGEKYCDAASKTHIINDPAQYYDYAISNLLLFQFHDHLSSKILHQNPYSTNYFGSKKVGEFLKKIMYPGTTRDWRELLKETTGKELSAKAMVKYFEPLLPYLKEINNGRKYTLTEDLVL
ncbi:MAG: M2 family metallopeptidase [Bacteroidota bacterium]